MKSFDFINSSASSIPWWIKSSLQGVLSGCVVAHVGAAASPLALTILPLLDIAAIRRALYLIDKSKSNRVAGKIQILPPGGATSPDADLSFSSWMRPAMSVCLNGAVALITAPLIAPHTLSSAKTERAFHELIAQPVTYGNAADLDLRTIKLLRSHPANQDRYWLTNSQLLALEAKRSTIEAMKKRRAEDEQIVKIVASVISTKAGPDNYDRILADIKKVSLSPRYNVVIPVAKRAELNTARVNAETVSAQVQKKNQIERMRLDRLRQEQDAARNHDSLCLNIYRQMIQSVGTGRGQEFIDMYQRAGCPSDLSRYVGR